jgi:hypothetical protein
VTIGKLSSFEVLKTQKSPVHADSVALTGDFLVMWLPPDSRR